MNTSLLPPITPIPFPNKNTITIPPNTRSVLTEEQQTDAYPTLTFEGAAAADVANQNAIWDNPTGQSINVLSSRVPIPAMGFTTATNGSYCGSVTKAQWAIGAAKLIRVMARLSKNVTKSDRIVEIPWGI